MDIYTILALTKGMFWKCILLTTPVLVLGMVIGVLISIIQTATSIQEQSLTTVPKLIITVLALIGMSRWMLGELISYANELLGNLQNFAL